jgi:hypothetical protein
MSAPRFETSRTVQDCIPAFVPKNSSAHLMIFVHPIDLRSFILKGVSNEFLVDPMAPVVAPPDFSKASRPVIHRRGTRTLHTCHASAQLGGGLMFSRL